MHAHHETHTAPHDGIRLHPTYLARLEELLPLFERLTEEDQDVIMLILYTWVASGRYYDFTTRPLHWDTTPLEEAPRVLGNKAVGE